MFKNKKVYSKHSGAPGQSGKQNSALGKPVDAKWELNDKIDHHFAVLLYVRAHLEPGNFPPLLHDLLSLCVN